MTVLFEKQVEKMYRKQMYTRCDDTGVAYYFSAADFEGLHSIPFSFRSPLGHSMQGYFYYYDDPVDDRIVVFEHGMGGGHRSYMREIEVIAKKGYRVFAYDHTGCMESGGENTNGFGQSLNDLDCAIKALRADSRYKNMKLTVIGHSWGGFSTMNIAAFHPDISHVVAISGFVSVKRMVNQHFGGMLKGFAKSIYALEKRSNPKYSDIDGVETLSGRSVKALIIHSADDPLVKKEHHFDVLKKALSDRPNVQFMLLDGKAHNPNYTAQAVRYKDEFFATLTKKLKNKELQTESQKKAFVSAYDWHRMTQQDMDVWNRIFDFIE
ncbi:MAG: alpha/beta fold hydrolase [Oscillospiraceae bacterium]|nr:alpha/beta fold hydrolase [Oscillospiraceae bacterium]